MVVVGITGLIGSGKSTVSSIFIKNTKVYFFNSDLYVKQLTLKNKSVQKEIYNFFPSCFVKGVLDKNLFRKLVFSNYNENIKILERIFHKRVVKKIKQFIFFKKLLFWKKNIILLEVPLLFESKINELCNYNILVSCSANIQEERVLKRDKIDVNTLNTIRAKQGDNNSKIEQVDFIINNNDDLYCLEQQVKKIINKINKC